VATLCEPSFHDSGKLRDEMIAKAEKTFVVFPKKRLTRLLPNFQASRMIPDSLTLQNSIWHAKKHGKITANAFEIQVAKADAGFLHNVLEVAFGLQSNQSDYIFVPYSLCSDNLVFYAQLLGNQNNCMQNHNNFLLAGITDNLMTQVPTKGKSPFREMLQDQPGVYRVDPTWQILNLGKCSISTDPKHH
jgi:hypothetical protein